LMESNESTTIFSKKYRKTKRSCKYELQETELIGLEAPQDLIELALWSTYVKGERVVSLLLVAEPESGKTELMKKYRKNIGLHVRRRFSACGLITDLIDGMLPLLFNKPKILGHVMVYDFANTFTYKANSVDSTIEFLDALTEEGIGKESAYWIKGEKLDPYENLKGGLIAGINTFGFFTASGKVKANLYKGGWFSRNLVATFSNSQVMNSKIFDSITDGNYRYDKSFRNIIKLNLPKKRVHVILPKRYAQDIRILASEIAETYSEDLELHTLKGFRLQKILIALAKASALRDGRKVVMDRDIERIRYLSNWFNLKMKPLKINYPFK